MAHTWNDPHAFAPGEDVGLASWLGELGDDLWHLRERADGPYTNTSGLTVLAGQVLEQDPGADAALRLPAGTVGLAGPFWVALTPFAIGATGWAARTGIVTLTYLGTAPVPGDRLQTAGVTGFAQVGTVNSFATALTTGVGGYCGVLLDGGAAAGGGGGGGGSSGSLLWDPYGLAVPPVVSDLSVHDHWSASGILTELDQTGDAAVFKNPGAAAIIERGAFGTTSGPLAVPAPPYTATLCLKPSIVMTNYWACLLSLRESSTDKRISVRLIYDSAAMKLDGLNWTDYQTPSGASFGSINWVIGFPLWVRIRDDATNRYWEHSMDGKWWNAWTSGSSGAHCTPDQAGFTMDSFGGGAGGLASMTVLSLSVVNTA